MSAGAPWHRDPVFPATALTSLGVLVLELALTRLFSATMHYHYAFMAISLALFGSGVAGVALYLGRPRLAGRGLTVWAAQAAILFSLATIAALGVVLLLPLSLEGTSGNALRLAAIYVACALPFFFGGSAITLAVMARTAVIGRLYLYDLAGAAVGCLLLVPLLDLLGGVNTILVVPVVAAAAGAFYGLEGGGRRGMGPGGLVALAAAGLLALNIGTGWIDVRQAKGVPEAGVVFARWNSFSRVTVSPVEARLLEIRIDADASTVITPGAGENGRHAEQRDRLAALAYRILDRPRVLIIGPGGGDDVIAARLFDAREITGVEINPIIALDIMSSEPFRRFAGSIYQQPGVRLVVDDARSFVRRSTDRYDPIQATMVDTWAATAAGAFALSENYIYTVEAFQDYTRHLAADGVLAFTRWYFEPPDQMLRLVSLAREAMRRDGVTDPARHLVVIRDRVRPGAPTQAAFLFKKSPFTEKEVRALESAGDRQGFTILYSPLTRPDNDFTRLAETERPEAVWSTFPTNIAPAWDDSPFFFNTVRPADLLHLGERAPEWRKSNLGTLVLFLLLGLASMLVVGLLAGPLWVARRRELAGAGPGGLRWLLYFSCLGLGFILVEVALVQRFILFLGPPVYALTVVLFSLLGWSALGSGLSGRIRGPRLAATLRLVLAALGAAVAAYAILLPPLF
jgi:hypothetical protein